MPKCRGCVHWEVCREYVTRLAAARGVDLDTIELEQIFDSDDCDHFHDRSRFVELPCKVGDMIYCLTLPEKRRATRITVTQYGLRITVNDMFSFDTSQIGKTVFLTREAAEQALKERES